MIETNETNTRTAIITALIAAMPVLIVPLLSWVLSRVGNARDTKRISYLSKRLDLVKKLRTYQAKFSVENNSTHDWSALNDEIDEILSHLKEHRISTKPAKDYEGLPRVQRLLLLFRPSTKKGWVLHVTFHLCLYIATASVIIIIITLINSPKEYLIFVIYIFNLLMYGIFAFALHKAAVRDKKAHELQG